MFCNLFIGNFQNIVIKCALFLIAQIKQVRRMKLYFGEDSTWFNGGSKGAFPVPRIDGGCLPVGVSGPGRKLCLFDGVFPTRERPTRHRDQSTHVQFQSCVSVAWQAFFEFWILLDICQDFTTLQISHFQRKVGWRLRARGEWSRDAGIPRAPRGGLRAPRCRVGAWGLCPRLRGLGTVTSLLVPALARGEWEDGG